MVSGFTCLPSLHHVLTDSEQSEFICIAYASAMLFRLFSTSLSQYLASFKKIPCILATFFIQVCDIDHAFEKKCRSFLVRALPKLSFLKKFSANFGKTVQYPPGEE